MRGVQLPWIWDVVPNYVGKGDSVWLITNRRSFSARQGTTIDYRRRLSSDVICGARTSFARDGVTEEDLVCTVVGDHAEIPHVGVPADCADQMCDHWKQGRPHLVVTGIGLTRAAT